MDAHPNRRTARHTALVLMLWAVLEASAWPAQVDVLSSRNDDDRSGANLREGLLRPDNVRPGQFGRLFSYALPGGDVYAQPLVVTSVGVPGRGTLDLLIVATTDNHVIAFDANGPVPGGTGVVWQQFLGEAPTMEDVWTRGCRLASPCLPAPGGNIRGRVGVVSTPAVDRQRGIIYVVNRILMPAGAIAYQLHALDLHTGADRPGSPTEIAANPGPAFVAGFHNQRPGLALARGQVVIGWGAHEDFLPYHGWLMSYRYLDEGRLEQSAVFNSTPDGDVSSTCALPGPAVTTLIATLNALAVAESILGAALLLTGDLVDAVLHFAAAATAKLAAEAAAVAAIPIAANQCAHGGLWMAGRAPAIDGDGNVLVMIGNGKNDLLATGARNLGNSLVKLDPRTLAVIDYFTPDNHLYINAADLDFGGSGPMIVPGTKLVMGGGKEGVMHIWNLNRLGGFAPGERSVVQKFVAGDESMHLDSGNDMPGGTTVGGFVLSRHAGHIMGGPVYWSRPASMGGARMFNWSENSELRGYAVDPDAATPVTLPAVARGQYLQEGHPGGILALSANGPDPSTGIVWAATYDATGTEAAGQGKTGALTQVRPGTMRAFAAEDLEEIWNSDLADADRLGNFAKFTPPTVANGRVYMATFSNEIVVYGLVHHRYVRRTNAAIVPVIERLLTEDEP